MRTAWQKNYDKRKAELTAHRQWTVCGGTWVERPKCDGNWTVTGNWQKCGTANVYAQNECRYTDSYINNQLLKEFNATKLRDNYSEVEIAPSVMEIPVLAVNAALALVFVK